MARRTLTAFYDFAICPVTYDFTVFMALAEMARLREGCENIRVVIVPAAEGRFRDEQVGYSSDNKTWRLRNIVIPSCWVFNETTGVTVCGTRAEAEDIETTLQGPVFPLGYTTQEPVGDYLWSGVSAALACGETLPQARPSAEATRIVADWLDARADGRKVLCVTLRESSHAPVRNSNRDAWLDFARSLNDQEYFSVFIPDTEQAFDNGEQSAGSPTFWIAPSLNLDLRLALYEQSWLNLMVTNGPCVLCWLTPKARFLMFKMLNNWANTTATYYASLGLEVGSQLPHATPFQRLVWEEDNADTIRSEFEMMEQAIEDAGGQPYDLAANATTEDPMAVAVRLQMTGRLEEATTIYQKIVSENPNNADAWHLLGIIANQADRADAAEKMILRAISLNPTQANYYINLAAVFRKSGRDEEAVNNLRRAIALSPSDSGAHADLAELLQIQGETDEARAALLKAIQLSPQSAPLYERAARVLQELGHVEEAASLYRRAIDLRAAAQAENARRLPEVPSISLTGT